jgi:hypothetical protein
MCLAGAVHAQTQAVTSLLTPEDSASLQRRLPGWLSVANITYHGSFDKALASANQIVGSMSKKSLEGLLRQCNGVNLVGMILFPEPQNGFLADPLAHAFACFSVLGSARDKTPDDEARQKYDNFMLRIQYVMTAFKVQEERDGADPRVLRWLTERNGGGLATVNDIRWEDVRYCLTYYNMGIRGKVM